MDDVQGMIHEPTNHCDSLVYPNIRNSQAHATMPWYTLTGLDPEGRGHTATLDRDARHLERDQPKSIFD
jgi:hypothetical protein